MKERTQEDEILERAIEIAASRVQFYEDAHSEETRRRKSAETKVAELEAENARLRKWLDRVHPDNRYSVNDLDDMLMRDPNGNWLTITTVMNALGAEHE